MGPAELAFRLLAAAILIVAPTILFLALWHGLYYLRDERLIEQLYGGDDSARPPQFDPSVLLSLSDGPAAGGERACPYCGRRTDDRLCSDCRDWYG
ncbi:hypothetical protein ACNS7O_01900 [Haloferacaceae archaeon DSL9]